MAPKFCGTEALAKKAGFSIHNFFTGLPAPPPPPPGPGRPMKNEKRGRPPSSTTSVELDELFVPAPGVLRKPPTHMRVPDASKSGAGPGAESSYGRLYSH